MQIEIEIGTKFTDDQGEWIVVRYENSLENGERYYVSPVEDQSTEVPYPPSELYRLINNAESYARPNRIFG